MPGKKKSSKERIEAAAAGLKTERQRRYFQGRIAGKSKNDAAVEAGYSQQTADNAKGSIEANSSMQAALSELGRLLREKIPLDKPVQRLDECMDATQKLVFPNVVGSKQKGTDRVEITEIVVPDYGERRQAVALYAKLTGQSIERHEVSVMPELNGRSDDDLKFFDKNGRWPEEAQQTA